MLNHINLIPREKPEQPLWLALASYCRAFGCLTAILVVSRETHAQELAKQVQVAWEKRQASVATIHYECEMKHTKMVPPTDETNEFDLPKDNKVELNPVVARSELTWCMSDGKFAYRNRGERWDIDKKAHVSHDFRACFDGVDDKSLVEGGIWPHGIVSVHGELKESHVARNAALIGLWLGYAPHVYLRNKGYPIEKLTVKDSAAVNEDGTQCIELFLPFSDGNVTILCVDPSRDFIPINYIHKTEGITTVQHKISYVPHDRIKWVVSKWVSNSFDVSGELTQSYAGQVRTVTTNEPLDDALFKLDFPPGTQVTERSAGDERYYIHESKGQRRKIHADEYGKLPQDNISGNNPKRRLPFTATIVLAVVLSVAVIIKYAKK